MKQGDEGTQQLVNIANAHFSANKKTDKTPLSGDIIKQAAVMVMDKRKVCEPGEYSPVTSEFLDLLRVLASNLYQDDEQRLNALRDISQYLLHK